MRKWFALIVLVVSGVVLFSDGSEGSERWRRRRCCCPCPVVIVSQPATSAELPIPARSITIKGKTYQIHAHPDGGVNDREELEDATPSGVGKASSSSSETFQGKARRLAKTTIFQGPTQPFPTVKALFDTLPTNQHMIDLQIGKGPAVNRVAEEKRNVRLTAFIYAFRKESDNDYHVILGDAPGTPNPRYFNVEVSGIPVGGTDENRQVLLEVRKAFKEAFDLGSSGPESYHRPHPPVPVRVTGSLFWDPEHEPPHTVGPNDFRPLSAFEIHPISEIQFLD